MFFQNLQARLMWVLATVGTGNDRASTGDKRASTPSYPLPLPCTGESCTEFTREGQDFNVIQHQNGTYFRISKDNGTVSGMVLASAPALSGPWVLREPILGPDVPLVDFNPADRSATSIWAPELHYIDGLYYCYYSILNRKAKPGFDIRVATSPTMDDNSWTDHGSVGIPVPRPGNLYATIDPNLLADFDTAPYGMAPARQLAWGSFASALFGVQLDASSPLRTANNPPYSLIQDQQSPIPDNSFAKFGSNRTEGSFHIQLSGWYYFFFSRGSCCGANVKWAYQTGVCRSKTATGPYFDRAGLNCAGNPDGTQNGAGTIFLQSHSPNAFGWYRVLSPGSVGIVNTTEGLMITYQYINMTGLPKIALALSFGHNYLGFDDEGWPFLADTAQPYPAPGNGTGGNPPNSAAKINLSLAFWTSVLAIIGVWLCS